MHVLEELGLGGGGVAAEEDVDVPAVFGVAAFIEGFVGTAEKLQQDALLYVVHLVDAGGEGSGEKLVDVGAGGCIFDLLLFVFGDLASLLGALGDLLGQLLLDGCRINSYSPLVHLLDVEGVDIGFVHTFHGALPGVYADLIALENAGNLDAVASLAEVHQLVERAYRDRVRRLAVWNIIGCFLELDDLLVREPRSVVHDLHRVCRLARFSRALSWLCDFAAVDLCDDGVVAH